MRPEDVAFHGCAALTIVALVALYMLRSPKSALSRWLDRCIDDAITAEFHGCSR